MTSFKNKSTEGYDHAFVGICSILDYKNFWEQLEINLDSGELVSAFYDVSSYKNLKAKNKTKTLNFFTLPLTNPSPSCKPNS